ncbi:NlpC/P60 family protein [Granulicoccus sp. GXG6511]|uniref:C40 family peptidase n=1 Tax=Granulicoccus sp. GXG6511 TaxID=3381351 RepID=UPI003D7E6420
MATRRQKALRAGVLGATIATLVVTGFPVTGHADPDTVAKAKAEVDKLAMEAAALDQDALAAQGKLDEAQKRLATREDDVKKQTERVAVMRSQVGQVALAQFQNRDLDPTTQLLLRADADTFLSQYATIQQVTANQNGALQDFQAEQANLADMKRGAAADVETINKSTEEIKAARAASASKLDDAEKVLARLTAEERARLQAEEERQAREAAAAAERAQAQQAAQREQSASRDRERTPAPTRTPAAPEPARPEPRPARAATQPPAPAAPPAATSTSRGLAALAFARAQIGKSYIYGGTGPSGYDCSGLTGAAWRSAGVSLPRTSQAQFGAGRPVSIDQLAPGDLVFYYSGISHVAIYAGGGQIVHASRPGKPIGYDPLRSMPIAGARRVG